jgi:hypothetical protein
LAAVAAVEAAGENERCHWAFGDEVILRGKDKPTRLAEPVE